MSLRIYDTRSKSIRPFEPVEAGKVGIYVCGATVQGEPHIGHVRPAIVFDVVRRWLTEKGYDVTLVRNVTDIDDKIIAVAAAQQRPWFAVAGENIVKFAHAYDALGCLPPTVEPRATGHMTEMAELIERLIQAGHAYASDGDVYFDVRSFPAYGALSGQSPDAMAATGRADERGKRDPVDFALWKAAKPGEPNWPTPWGRGRPGWHLECSAMSTKYLGSTFDIHGGGLDLRFPHHENELAQSAAAGDGFARYWMHNGLLNIAGEKMSKSLGNSLTVGELLGKARPQVLRYYFVQPHYRSQMDFSEAGLVEAEAAYSRIESFLRRAEDKLGYECPPDKDINMSLWRQFGEAMDDDFGTPEAISLIHGAVRTGNAQIVDDDPELDQTVATIRRMLGVLGLDPGQWPRTESDLTPVVDSLVAAMLEAREQARARKDYAAADALRDRLATAGLVIEDTPDGARWHLAGEGRE